MSIHMSIIVCLPSILLFMYWFVRTVHVLTSPARADRHTFVMSSADWCGPSRQVYPHLYKLAYALKDSSEIAIAKIDTDDNEMDSNVWPETGIPTMKLFVRGKQRTPVVYDGDRTYEGMVRFIEQETGCSLASLLAGQYPLYVAKRGVLDHMSSLVAAIEGATFPNGAVPHARQFIGLHFTDPGRLAAEQSAEGGIVGTSSIILPGAGNAAIRVQLRELVNEVAATDDMGNVFRYTGKIHNLAPVFEGLNGSKVLRVDDGECWCLQMLGDDGTMGDISRRTDAKGEILPPEGTGWVRLQARTGRDKLSPSFSLTVNNSFKRALPSDKKSPRVASSSRVAPTYVRVGFFAAPIPAVQVLLVAVDTSGQGKLGREGTFGPATGTYPRYLTWKFPNRLAESIPLPKELNAPLQPTGMFSADREGKISQIFKHKAGRTVSIPVPADFDPNDLVDMAPSQWCASPQEFSVNSP
jgi:thiol-disulfide isomerase/thioredoxin